MKPVKRKSAKAPPIITNDVLENISLKGSDIVKLSRLLLDFGFILDGKKYFVNGNKVTSSNWGNSVPALITKAKTLPRIGYALNTMAINVWHKYELVKIDYEVWEAKEWCAETRAGTMMHEAPQRKVQAYIASKPASVKFSVELSELKTIHARLKSLINTVQQQHFSILAILHVYKRNPSEDIGNTAFSSVDTLEEVKQAMFGDRE